MKINIKIQFRICFQSISVLIKMGAFSPYEQLARTNSLLLSEYNKGWCQQEKTTQHYNKTGADLGEGRKKSIYWGQYILILKDISAKTKTKFLVKTVQKLSKASIWLLICFQVQFKLNWRLVTHLNYESRNGAKSFLAFNYSFATVCWLSFRFEGEDAIWDFKKQQLWCMLIII